MTGFYIKCNTWLKLFKIKHSFDSRQSSGIKLKKQCFNEELTVRKNELKFSFTTLVSLCYLRKLKH